MFERIIVPLDGSSLAEGVLPRAAMLAKECDGQLILMQAYTPYAVSPYEFLPEALDAGAQAESYIGRKVKELRSQDVRARGSARLGSPAGTILDAAAEEQATLIALSTHGRTGIARWAFGSVAEKILRASPIPVLVYRLLPAAPPKKGPLRKILLPLDGSERARALVPLIAALARRMQARLIVLHVVDAGQSHEPARDSLQEITGRLAAEGVEGQILVREGDPATEILDACAVHDVDLLAMNTHGRTGPTRWVFGSVTEKVLRASPVPLLVARRPGTAPRLTTTAGAASEER